MTPETNLPSPDFVNFIARKILKLPVNRVCGMIEKPGGVENLRFRIRAHGHDVYADNMYFPSRQA